MHGKGGFRVKSSLLAFLVNHSARNCGNSDYGNYNSEHNGAVSMSKENAEEQNQGRQNYICRP